ncbi:MAG: EAL domain-containing protein [Spirochaetales bacterium]|uniref:EAL domain-containing protein n=1 Tax=Candidatus Thalassospirochaeta sargassi TaxID=3119039 RepID=A0AAJ1IHA4_9SPIO|nr:EAL domain-containing protein [Spirochaetales bacterium]
MADKYKYIVDTSKDFITLINRNYIYEVVNSSYERMIHKPHDEIMNHSVSHVWGEETFRNKIKSYLDKCLSGQEVHYIDTFKFGLENRYMHVSYYPYRENGDGVTHALVFTHDITKLGKIESRLINYEFRDPLTGLFNRKSLDIILDMELEKAKRTETDNLRALLFIDILNYKEISKKFGYEIGNILLENTGLRIKEGLRDSDFTFSYVNSELVVFLTVIASRIDAARVAEKLYNSITYPYQHQQYSIKLKAAIGIAVFPDDCNGKNELLKKAVSASEEAVRAGRSFMYYDSRLHTESIKRLNIEAELTAAFHNQELELYYQPIVGCRGNILGAEALIRWNHKSKGLVSPIEFIPVAEDTGLIEEIGKWVIFSASRQLAEWVTQYDIYVSLNLCAREFSNEELVEITKNALQQADNLNPAHLKLEITESEGIRHPEKFIKRIEMLKNMGIEIYIDDFGTGQSSLEYLKNIPADVLKIDKIFIDNIHKNNSDREFLEAMVSLVKTRGKKIITEGISCSEQADIVKSLDCERMQGFYFSRPLPAVEFEALLKSDMNLPL